MAQGDKGRQRINENLQEIRKGYWKVPINIPAGMSPDGKRHRHVEYVHGGKRDARAKRYELLDQRAKGTLRIRATGTVEAFLQVWLDGKRPTVAARTSQRWEGLIKNQIAPAIGNMRLRDVRPATLRKMYADLQGEGLSGTTRQKVHALLHQAFKQAVIDGELTVNPCDAVQAPRIDTPEAQVLDEKEAQRLLTALEGTAVYVPVLVTLHTGLRLGELLALRWADVDLEERTLIVRGAIEEARGRLAIGKPKSGKIRKVRLTTGTVVALAAHKTSQSEIRARLGNRWIDEDLVFPLVEDHRGKSAGRIWRPSSFSRVYRDKARAAGFSVGLHAAGRHTHATALLRAGVPAKVVSERLGHSTTRLTQDTYQHVLPDQQQEAVEAFERQLANNPPDDAPPAD